ncbi:MAG TPA: tail fiber protein [Fimbriimonadaceae bacterium]|nr:tail fiber protein [Fimbriimonadaceae bacterium]
MNPYLGEIKLVPYTFAPEGWAFCQGQLMSISQNNALFALLGTIYGGDGVSTFALPDYRGRVALSQGNSSAGSTYTQGEIAGLATVTLTTGQIPSHNHLVSVDSNLANQQIPVGQFMAKESQLGNVYGPPKLGTGAGPNLSQTGGSGAHENRQPYLCLNYIIALQGIFPTPN